jgi:hypothetical protein
MLVISFDYLLAIIRQKTCGSTVTRNHTGTLLPKKVKLIPMLTETWERVLSLYKETVNIKSVEMKTLITI